MGRRAKFDSFQVAEIRASKKTGAQLAEAYDTSLLTIHNVRAFKGAYREHVLDLGEPILNIHGNIVGVAPTAADPAPDLSIPLHTIQDRQDD